MPWRSQLLQAHPIIETSYSGLLGKDELFDAFRATVALAQASGTTRFLADCTLLEGGHSIVHLYTLVDTLMSSGADLGALREAVLLPALPGSAEDVRFWETACLNRGLRVKVFQDRPSAIAWLLE